MQSNRYAVQKVKCVIAEADELQNEIYCHILGHEADIDVAGRAHNSHELLSLLESGNAGVVLQGVEFPTKKTGLELCRDIAAMNVNVVLLAGDADKQTVITAYEYGAADYVLRTASGSELVDAVRQAHYGTSPIRGHAASVIRGYFAELSERRISMIHAVKIVNALTTAELNILALLIAGERQRDIAKIRGVELSTVKAHISNMLHKLHIGKTTTLLETIRSNGLDPVFLNFLEEEQ